MAVFICEKCGANLSVPEGTRECVCGYCGTRQIIEAGGTDVHSREKSIALERAQFAMEDHEWDQAMQFCEKALNLDPRCGEAYWGKFLAANHWTVKEIMDLSFASVYEKYDPDWMEVRIEYKEHIAGMVSQYSVPGFLNEEWIRSQYHFTDHYQTASGILKKQKDRLLKKINSDTSLRRAKQFGSPALKNQISQCEDRMISYMDQRIESQRLKDEEAIGAIRAKHRAFQNEADKRVIRASEDAKEKREAVYQAYLLRSKANLSEREWLNLINGFISLDGYKDSTEIAEKLRVALGKKIKRRHRREDRALFRRKYGKKIFWGIVILILFFAFVILPNAK